MFDVRIKVGKVGYEKTITTLFPAILDKCWEHQASNLLFRLLLELGEDALPVLFGIIERLSEDTKKELTIQLMNGYHNALTDMFNGYLQKDSLGRNFTVQNIYIQQKDGVLELIGEGVNVDYKSLCSNDEIRSKINVAALSINGFGEAGKKFAYHAGNALRGVAGAIPWGTERLGLKLMQREEIKEKLIDLAQAALEEKGLQMELESISFVQACDQDVVSGKAFGDLKISDELETELIKALAGYIRMVVN